MYVYACMYVCIDAYIDAPEIRISGARVREKAYKMTSI